MLALHSSKDVSCGAWNPSPTVVYLIQKNVVPLFPSYDVIECHVVTGLDPGGLTAAVVCTQQAPVLLQVTLQPNGSRKFQHAATGAT